MSGRVEDHYANPDIVPRILAALRQVNGADAPVTPDALALLDHFHGRGVLATREMAALLKPQAGERILDIGSGIGGPARWIAARFGCHVTGVDLTQAFCDAAVELNAATGMA
jgi:protein-L-isoaspartate O-methyltransferase